MYAITQRRKVSKGTALTGPLVLTAKTSNGEQIFELGDGLMTALFTLGSHKIFDPYTEAPSTADLNELRESINAVIDALQAGFTVTT